MSDPDQPSVETLVAGALAGRQADWDALVERFATLVWAIARGHRLGDADAADVSQTVWLTVVERLPTLREPAAFPGWLATTTRRECQRASQRLARTQPLDASTMVDLRDDRDDADPAHRLLAEERAHAVRTAFGQLSEVCRTLLTLLATDPPPSYAEIGRLLDMPVGSIGPTRARCLDKLRRLAPLAGITTA